LALTSPISGGLLVGIVRSRTQTTEIIQREYVADNLSFVEINGGGSKELEVRTADFKPTQIGWVCVVRRHVSIPTGYLLRIEA
jgi:hypothetical protein